MFSLYLAPSSRATLIRMWHSTDVALKPYPRGFHLTTREVVAALPELACIQTGLRQFEHTLEGDDDMAAHIKAALLGSSLTLPVRGGHLHLGTWQGVYLCEHRDRGGARTLTLTMHGE